MNEALLLCSPLLVPKKFKYTIWNISKVKKGLEANDKQQLTVEFISENIVEVMQKMKGCQ